MEYSCRKSVHSFSEDVNAFSIAFDCKTTGFTALSYMEDLYLIMKVSAVFMTLNMGFLC